MIAARKEADIKYQAFLDNDKVDVNFAKLEYVYKSYFRIIQMGKPFCQVLKLAKCMMAHSYTSKNMELMRTTFPH